MDYELAKRYYTPDYYYLDKITEAREWARRMYRRALKAEAERDEYKTLYEKAEAVDKGKFK